MNAKIIMTPGSIRAGNVWAICLNRLMWNSNRTGENITPNELDQLAIDAAGCLDAPDAAPSGSHRGWGERQVSIALAD